MCAVVDDHPMVRNAIADLLRDRGAKVIDVVVADIEMPGQGGFWMIRELLSRPALRLDPAIALTARGRDHPNVSSTPVSRNIS